MRSAKSTIALAVGLALAAVRLPAEAPAVPHPVFPAAVTAEAAAALRQETAPVLGFPPAEIDAFIGARTSIENIACPNCQGGTPERRDWRWSLDDPGHVTCGYCGLTFPNDRFPLTQVTTVTDPAGTVQHFRYYEGRNGYKHYLEAKVENCRKQYMERQAKNLALLYAATRDEAYAHQCALILDRLASVYAHYNVHGLAEWVTFAPVIYEIAPLPTPPDGLQPVPGLWKDLSGYNRFPPLGRSAYPYCAARRGDGVNNWYYGEISPELVEAYDLVAASREFDRLSAARGRDVRRGIEDFFRATANYVRSYPIYLGNMDPRLIRGLALVGRVIGEPEFVHDALRRAKTLMDWQFYPDGMWREGTPSYQGETLNSMFRALDGPLRGYSDPRGYVNPIDRRHFANLDAVAEVPMLRESMAALDRLRLPNGEYLSIHDAWTAATLGKPVPGLGAHENVVDAAYGFAQTLDRPERASAEAPFQTQLFWGLGEAMLGLGRGEAGVQADLHFGRAFEGHAHYDDLDLILFGEGRELVPDLGYTHTELHPFDVSSLAHNLVVVDERNQDLSDGHLIGWGAVGGSVRFCEAGDEGAYPGVVSTYRRALALVELPRPGAYVVDVFRVKGGSRHDWLIHGSADFPQTVDCSLPVRADRGGWPATEPPGKILAMLEAEATAGPRAPIRALYGLFDGVEGGPARGVWSLTFRYAQPGGGSLRTTLLDQPGTTTYCGTLPAVRPAHEDNRNILRWRMPAVLVRRQGDNLASVFVAVHEPFREGPQIVRVERLKLAEGGPDSVGVVCRGDGFTDYHLCGLDAGSRLRADGSRIGATGRYAFVRTQNGRVVRMVLIDGTEVRCGDQVLTAPPAAAGAVVGVRRREAGDTEDSLLVDVPIPPRPGRAGERVIVEFGDGSTYALAVRGIRKEGGQSAILLATRPGFTLADDRRTATQTHIPHHVMPGPPRFRLPVAAEWPAVADPAGATAQAGP